MSRPVELNGVDFLLMAQNGTLVVDIDAQGNITGINLDDATIERFDGMLVALHKFSEVLMNTTYTVIPRTQQKAENTPQIETSEKIENIEE